MHVRGMGPITEQYGRNHSTHTYYTCSYLCSLIHARKSYPRTSAAMFQPFRIVSGTMTETAYPGSSIQRTGPRHSLFKFPARAHTPIFQHTAQTMIECRYRLNGQLFQSTHIFHGPVSGEAILFRTASSHKNRGAQKS